MPTLRLSDLSGTKLKLRTFGAGLVQVGGIEGVGVGRVRVVDHEKVGAVSGIRDVDAGESAAVWVCGNGESGDLTGFGGLLVGRQALPGGVDEADVEISAVVQEYGEVLVSGGLLTRPATLVWGSRNFFHASGLGQAECGLSRARKRWLKPAAT